MSEPGEHLTREGHLSWLSLHRVLTGELELEPPHDSSEDCQRELEAWRQEHAELAASLPPSFAELDAAMRKRGPRRRRPIWWSRAAPAVGLLAAVLALAAFVALRQARPDALVAQKEQLRLKGQAVALELYVHDGERVRVALDGDTVAPGDRIGFKLFVKRPGWVAIVGIDQRGEPYVGYPQDDDKAVSWQVTDGGVELEAALELDDVLGRERVVVVHCPRDFALAEATQPLVRAGVDGPLQWGGRLEGCHHQDLVLHKRDTPR